MKNIEYIYSNIYYSTIENNISLNSVDHLPKTLSQLRQTHARQHTFIIRHRVDNHVSLFLYHKKNIRSGDVYMCWYRKESFLIHDGGSEDEERMCKQRGTTQSISNVREGEFVLRFLRLHFRIRLSKYWTYIVKLIRNNHWWRVNTGLEIKLLWGRSYSQGLTFLVGG